MTMLNAMPGAYASALLGALPVTQCTDGRTDGQDGEPPSLAVDRTFVTRASFKRDFNVEEDWR